LIPRADADADLDGVSDDGDGLSNLSDAEGLVPFNNLFLADTEIIDAWGNAIRYQAGVNAAATGVWSGNAEDPALSLHSFGPDGLDDAGLNDDITITYSAIELVGILAQAGLNLDWLLFFRAIGVLTFVLIAGCAEPSSEYHNLGMRAYTAGNFDEAATYLRKSADLGDHDSQAILGSMYILGQGVPQDREQAAMWLYPAAESGHPEAQMFMGVLHFTGPQTEDEIRQARYWLQLAADKGEDKAADLLARLPPE
jgi:hypothetical protein